MALSFIEAIDGRTCRLEYLEDKVKEQESAITLLRREREMLAARVKTGDRLASVLEHLSSFGVTQWRWTDNDGTMNTFDIEVSRFLEQAHEEWKMESSGSSSNVELRSGTHTYNIDFATMTQQNTKTSRRRPITRKVVVEKFASIESLQSLLIQLQEMKLHNQNMSETKDKLKKMMKERNQVDTELQHMSCKLDQMTMQRDDERRCLQRQKRKRLVERKERKEVELENGLLKDLIAKRDRDYECCKSLLDHSRKAVLCLEDRLDSARRQHDELQQDLLQVTAELEQRKQEIDDCKQEHKQQIDDCIQEYSKLIEFWKSRSVPRQNVLSDVASENSVCALLKNLSHKDPTFQGVPSRCFQFQHHSVRKVQRVHNPHMWKRYCDAKRELQAEHHFIGVKAEQLQPVFQGFDSLFSESIKLETDLNEFFLVHGCSTPAAKMIISEGFDIRRAGAAGGSMYGHGIYFAQEPCKSYQYTDGNLRTLIIARVALGDIKYLTGPYSGRLPPSRSETEPEKGRFDALVINPNQSQMHREFVIFEGARAYPEMLITFECQ